MCKHIPSTVILGKNARQIVQRYRELTAAMLMWLPVLVINCVTHLVLQAEQVHRQIHHRSC